MKQINLVFPVARANEVAFWMLESGAVLGLSWITEGPMFAPSEIHAIYAVPDARESECNDRFKKFIKATA